MSVLIYIIIIILITMYVFGIWNSTKEFEEIYIRIVFLVVGTLCITLLTYIIFLFSKIGVDYPIEDMIGKTGKMILLIFVPINGFLTMPQIANLIVRKKDGNISKEDIQKKIRLILIIFIILIIFECVYFKKIQTGMINYINIKR